MFDYLSSYNLSKAEREKLLMSVLKRIRSNGKEPLWLHKKRNFRTWRRIEKLYGKDCVWKIIQQLEKLNLIQSQGKSKPFIVTERGNAYCKRGFIEFEMNKFSNPKYPLIISIAALLVSIFGNEYFWKAVKWIWKYVTELLS